MADNYIVHITLVNQQVVVKPTISNNPVVVRLQPTTQNFIVKTIYPQGPPGPPGTLDSNATIDGGIIF